ncbi:MAG: glycosyl transferase [Lentimicrobium sp.]|nr:glycosyl transferase [Lentimicrobium sp.]
MKILYAIQGTGNGHISRARDIVPVLQKNHEVDLLISGTQAEVEFPFPVKYRFNGLGFVFGASGGIDLVETYKKNYIRVLLSEINSLPVHEYDLVVNDFEPVSAWACYLSGTRCIAVSHQSAVLNKKAPQPKEVDIIGKAILKNYAPSDARYGFHFRSYDEQIFTPVIRAQVRNQLIENQGHYTVYLPSYDDQRILKVLKSCGNARWQVFSKHNRIKIDLGNITIQPINNEAFIASMATSAGVICGAGFETPAEALFMQKKLLVIPMKGQYEQLCNAAALKEMGVPVLKTFKTGNAEKITAWIENGRIVAVDYPDNTEEIINRIMEINAVKKNPLPESPAKDYSVEKFRNLLLKKLVARF